MFTLPLYGILLLVGASIAVWRRGPGSGFHAMRYVISAIALGAYVVTIPALPNCIVSQIEALYPVPGDVELAELVRTGDAQIVVLTGGWFRSVDHGYEVMMGSNSWERTWTAVRLWKRIGGTLIF